MKKNLFVILVAVFFSHNLFAQLTGVKTIPGDYPTLAAAISALNASGVGTGGVTFNINAGYIETFTNPTAGRITTLTSSVLNPIVFQKNGTGNNPVITSGTGTGLTDAIIVFGGCDYVTFNGINLKDKLTNFTANAKMEWGYAILKNSATDGSQYITIKNCSVTLDKNYDYTKGIYSDNHTISSTDPLTVTDFQGTNSNLKIYSNSLVNCYSGIYICGYNHSAEPYDFYDQNNEIGKEGGNTINNVAGVTDPGYGIYTIYQNNLEVANNIITSTMGATSGTAVPYGICLKDALNANLDLYNNSVSMQFSSSFITDFYAIYSSMGGSGTDNIVNIYNNTVSGCTYPNATGGWIYYMKFVNTGVTCNVYGNTVSNNTSGSTSQSSSGRIDHIWINKTVNVEGPIIVHNNSITGNSRFNNLSQSHPHYFLYVAGSGTTLDCFDNLVDNNIANTNNAVHGLGISFNDSQYKKVHHNTITNISQNRGSLVGINNYNGTLGYFYNNVIQNLSSDPASSYGSIFGIYQTDYGTEMYFYNNFICDLANPGCDATLGTDYNILCGIYFESTGNRRGIYNNTVYLNSTVTGTQTNYGSSAICAWNFYNVDLRNNILINTSAHYGPEGKTVAIRQRSSGISGFTSNYNNIYAGTPGAKNLIFYDGDMGFQNLKDYSDYVFPQELQSVTENSPFVNVVTQPWDVHLQNNTETQCESGGSIINTPFPIITDMDGDPRYPNPGYPVNPSDPAGAPDIGADEVGGLSNDLVSPLIIYSPLMNTYLTTDRVLYADFTDGTGVPDFGLGKPCLYWKINTGSYETAQGHYEGGQTFSFTFGAGAVLGDIVSYYIVAQDEATPPNVGAFPSVGASGFTNNPPACSTPPVSPSVYTINIEISGIYHVGAGKTYSTLTAAIDDLNSKILSGPLTFILDDNTYPAETFPIQVLPNPGSSPVNTVTLQANTNVFPVLSGSVGGNCIIMLKGIDYITIDGSDGISATKRITFANNSGEIDSFTIGITNTDNDPSRNVTIKNCTITGNNSDIMVETYLIILNANGGNNGGGYDNLLIRDNIIKRAKNGIYVNAAFNNRNHNITIANNTIGSDQPADFITRWGIAITQTDNTLISNNEIMGPSSTIGTYALFGIIYYDNCTNTKITCNKIHDWISSGPGSWGIKCDNDNNTTVTEISNNIFYNIGAYGMNPGVSQNQANGIMVRQGGNMRIWNNSIHLTGDYLYGGDTFQPSSSCILFWNQSPVNSDQIDIRNNILQNSMTNSFVHPDTTIAMGRAYGIMFTNAVSFSVLDNNDYYIDGYRGAIAQKYCVGGTCMIDYPTLASWQTYTGMEANSIVINPQFTSLSDLNPTSTMMNNEGVYVLSADLNGKYRSNPCDMGAYEFAPDQVMSLKVALEGAFNPSTDLMNTELNSILPITQPYNPSLPYFGNNDPVWLYAGLESVSAIPADAVDWIIIELRDAANAAAAGPETTIPGGIKAALLKNDGTIIGVENNPYLIFAGVPVLQNLFLVIHHRNHLSVLSSNPVVEIDGIYSWDFTSSSEQAFNNGQKQLSVNVFGMIGGDGNGDAQVDLQDKTGVWNMVAAEKDYSGGDYNMNGEISNQDKNDIWNPNLGTGSQVQF